MGKPRIDETGKIYGKLTVLEYISEKGKKSKWKCKCECGNIILVDGADLRRGHTRSCGCYQKEQTSKASLIDLTGQFFGELEVLERDFNYVGKHVPTHWFCLCHACGNIDSFYSESLRKGQISCGCLKSKGEYKITKLLVNNNIKFISQYHFQDVRNRYYDFALLDDNDCVIKLIEFDGIQHYYRPSQWLWTQNMTLEEQQQRDKEKNQIAFTHNIPLIRIPYWYLDNLTIEQILSDKFLIKEEKIKNE